VFGFDVPWFGGVRAGWTVSHQRKTMPARSSRRTPGLVGGRKASLAMRESSAITCGRS
jgi:hypothetical protein